MGVKLVVSDLDGTLLNSEHMVSPRTRRAIEAVRQAGIKFTLASGRSYQSMRTWSDDLAIDVPLISYQGALITDPSTRQPIYSKVFPMELVRDVCAFCQQRHLSLTLYAQDEIYVADKRQSDDFYEAWFGLPWHVVQGDLAESLPCAPIKFIIIGSQSELDAVEPELEAELGERMEILRSHAYFLEGLALGVNKGTALAWLAERLGVAQQETMAIGDNGNDIAMLEWAGCGVVMESAIPRVKEAANRETLSCDEDGVALVLEELLDGNSSAQI